MIDYYQNQRTERKKRRRVKILIALASFVLIAVVAGIIYFLHSSYSRIEKINVTMDVQDSSLEANISQAYQSVLDGNKSFVFENIFGKNSVFLSLLDGEEISKSIENLIPEVSEVKIETNVFSRSVNIVGSDRVKFGLWCYEKNLSDLASAATTTPDLSTGTSSNCLWFDRGGTAFLQGPNTEGQLIYKVIDAYDNPVALGQKILDQDLMDNIAASFDFLDNSGLGYKTIYLSDPKLEEAHTDTSVTPVIYFSLRNNPTYALKAFLESKSQLSKASYVDLRIPNRIYYK